RHVLAESLSAAQPDDPEQLCNLSKSHELMAFMSSRTGDSEGHRFHWVQAGAITARLVEIQPDNDSYVQQYILSKLQLGKIAANAGDFERSAGEIEAAALWANRMYAAE